MLSLSPIIIVIMIILIYISKKYKFGSKYSKSIEFEYHIKEMKFIAKQRKCKVCNQKVERVHDLEYVGEGWISSMNGGTIGEKFKMNRLYKCDKCRLVFDKDEFI
ncbi:hypothetical protein ACFFSY_20510 [Paenibacillus aurantiacus]|uniref:Uncharacterized protein n=1 Tax=Paenibacillus aurantiacus TaxID=1936118 RepID=A0ABV5KSV6_9BACL